MSLVKCPKCAAGWFNGPGDNYEVRCEKCNGTNYVEAAAPVSEAPEPAPKTLYLNPHDQDEDETYHHEYWEDAIWSEDPCENGAVKYIDIVNALRPIWQSALKAIDEDHTKEWYCSELLNFAAQVEAVALCSLPLGSRAVDPVGPTESKTNDYNPIEILGNIARYLMDIPPVLRSVATEHAKSLAWQGIKDLGNHAPPPAAPVPHEKGTWDYTDSPQEKIARVIWESGDFSLGWCREIAGKISAVMSAPTAPDLLAALADSKTVIHGDEGLEAIHALYAVTEELQDALKRVGWVTEFIREQGIAGKFEPPQAPGQPSEQLLHDMTARKTTLEMKLEQIHSMAVQARARGHNPDAESILCAIEGKPKVESAAPGGGMVSRECWVYINPLGPQTACSGKEFADRNPYLESGGKWFPFREVLPESTPGGGTAPRDTALIGRLLYLLDRILDAKTIEQTKIIHEIRTDDEILEALQRWRKATRRGNGTGAKP